jgi:hypothetical protein
MRGIELANLGIADIEFDSDSRLVSVLFRQSKTDTACNLHRWL